MTAPLWSDMVPRWRRHFGMSRRTAARWAEIELSLVAPAFVGEPIPTSPRHALERAADCGALVGSELTKLADVAHRHVRGVYRDADRPQLCESTRQRLGFETQPRRNQHFVVGQRDDAGVRPGRGERGEELGDSLHATLRLE